MCRVSATDQWSVCSVTSYLTSRSPSILSWSQHCWLMLDQRLRRWTSIQSALPWHSSLLLEGSTAGVTTAKSRVNHAVYFRFRVTGAEARLTRTSLRGMTLPGDVFARTGVRDGTLGSKWKVQEQAPLSPGVSTPAAHFPMSLHLPRGTVWTHAPYAFRHPHRKTTSVFFTWSANMAATTPKYPQGISANVPRWLDVVLMLCQRLRRWPGIKTTSVDCSGVPPQGCSLIWVVL